MLSFLRFIVIVLIIFFSTVNFSFAANVPLYENVKWIKLLHYKPYFGGYKGLVNSQEFYVSENGRYSPQQEMEAEIEAFNKGDKIKCEFPARFYWLQKQGKVSGNLDDCQEYNDFIRDIKPNGITILFTNAFMSNPASLFGHTLIRIDTSRKGTQMLAHGSNFGANSGTDSGLFFAIKGLVGGYFGGYTISPYWDIINTYNNIENRDIWEYHLNLTQSEQVEFLNHLYEMKNALIRYFFLTKNCSYMILELIEAVRPQLDLTSSYQYWAIPLDTLKTIKQVDGLVDKINYRPARYTKLQTQIKSMNKAQFQAFLQGIEQQQYDMKQLSEDEQSAVLETEYQYFQYVYTAGDMELKEYRRNSFKVLRKRSNLPKTKIVLPEGEDPSLSHGSFQIALNGGIYNHKSFEQISVRPAYTALTDNNWGLIKGAGISVLESIWRYYNQSHKTVLQKFTGLRIYSLVPSDRVFSPWSYTTNMDIHREYNPRTQDEGYVGELEFGMGKTYALSDSFWLYGILNTTGQYGGFIPDNAWIGLTPEVGMFADMYKFRLHLATQKTFASHPFGNRFKFKSNITYELNKNLLLDLSYFNSHNHYGHDEHELTGGIKYFF